MVREYDTQLLESVSVRRRRLRDAVLFGSMRQRRTFDQHLGHFFIGLIAAAVVCAAAVGWSYLQHEKALQQKQNPSSLSAVTGSAYG